MLEMGFPVKIKSKQQAKSSIPPDHATSSTGIGQNDWKHEKLLR